MFEGLKTMDQIVSEKKEDLLKTWKERLEKWKETSKESRYI